MNRLLRSLAPLACAALSLTAGASTTQARSLDVVLLGDSYASGVGAGGGYSEECTRSPRAFGEVFGELARARGLTVSVKNFACGGSTVAELSDQIPKVDKTADLVLMMTGGNDTDVSGSVLACFFPVIAGPNTCKSALEPAIAKAPSVQPALVLQLTELRKQLREGAKVVFASYPYLAPPQGHLLKTWFASYDSGLAIRRLGDALDAAALGAIGTVNAAAGRQFVTFVPTKTRFIGHEPDPDPWSENSARWIHEFTGLETLSEPYHPTAQGHRELAAAVFAAAGSAGDFGVSH